MKKLFVAASAAAIACATAAIAAPPVTVSPQVTPKLTPQASVSATVRQSLAAAGGGAGKTWIVGPFDQYPGTQSWIEIINPSYSQKATGRITCHRQPYFTYTYDAGPTQSLDWDFAVDPQKPFVWDEQQYLNKEPSRSGAEASPFTGWCAVDASAPIVVLTYRRHGHDVVAPPSAVMVTP